MLATGTMARLLTHRGSGITECGRIPNVIEAVLAFVRGSAGERIVGLPIFRTAWA